MPILHVRNVPEDLYESLKQQAAAQNRSLSAQVITILARAVEQPERSQREILENIQRMRSFHPIEAGAPDSTTLLRQERAR
jgi:plasmid stability protein